MLCPSSFIALTIHAESIDKAYIEPLYLIFELTYKGIYIRGGAHIGEGLFSGFCGMRLAPKVKFSMMT